MSREYMHGAIWRALAGAGLALALAGLSARPATAYPRYNSGCQACHGAFTDGASPKGTVFPSNNKHEMHRGSSYMNADCNLCHTQGDQRNPYIGSSNGTSSNPGVGCTGCHGRNYAGLGDRGVGLRAHHALHGVNCSGCHPSDPAPLPESVVPTYYGTPDTLADDPCNSTGLEDWSGPAGTGDGFGLDNDGDDLYDGDDPDCAGCPYLCGDLDGSGGPVNLDDFAAFRLCYGLTGPNPPECSQQAFMCSDLDGDGVVSLNDFATFALWYGLASTNTVPDCLP